jgi:cellulose synthase/poly-beta-1,6-N-acetylglucosamine synthase-like glycosyltransferase
MLIKGLGYLYTIVLAGLSVYAVHVLLLIFLFFKHRNNPQQAAPTVSPEALPTVTVQIPLRNERYVVHRVLDAVAALDWPRDRLEIQVLDDSDDATTNTARTMAERLRRQGLDIRVLHRDRAHGNKAGALAAGLEEARGEFIAIFDADFCPRADFLQQTVPHFVDTTELGIVQARWGHLNAEYSPITRAQALLMDAHFTVEHIARNRSGLLMNFNGTAGVWRRQAILDAGGWQSDTVAEDLDLSYRAQLHGWKARYLPDVVAPAELPPLVAAFKRQQYRWAKGATQVLRKLAGPILRSRRLTWAQKVMALLHLSGYLTQPLFLMLLLLMLPMVLFSPPLPTTSAVLGTVIAIPPLLYIIGQITLYPDWLRRILAYPVTMLLGMGIALSTTIAIADGFLHWGGAFERTPKYHLQKREGKWQQSDYQIGGDFITIGEIILGIYAAAAFYQAFVLHQQLNLLPLIATYLGAQTLMVLGTLLQQFADRLPTR